MNTHRLWILSLEESAAAAAVLRMVLLHFAYALNRHQLRPRSGMSELAATLAATALLPGWRLKTEAVTGEVTSSRKPYG